MRKYFEAAFVLTLSIALTVGIMFILIPKHARGGGRDAGDSPGLQPAVFVHGTHDRPGTSALPKVPEPTNQAQRGGCPYLNALAASSGCPAAPKSNTTISCPYLMQIHSQLIEAKEESKTQNGKTT